jgi:hypothetical protein
MELIRGANEDVEEMSKTLQVVISILVMVVVGLFGWVLLAVSEIQKEHAADDAVEELANQITDVVNNIDREMDILRNNQEWIRATLTNRPPPTYGEVGMAPNMLGDGDDNEYYPAPEPPMPSPEPEFFDGPKYDLRQQQEIDR